MDAQQAPNIDLQIGRLAEVTGRTEEEILSSALTLYELALKAMQHGKKFGVAESDQELLTEVVEI